MYTYAYQNHFAVQQKLAHCKSITLQLYKKKITRISLVVQWLRIHLPMHGTQVQSLVQEDSTYYEATKPICCSY